MLEGASNVTLIFGGFFTLFISVCSCAYLYFLVKDFLKKRYIEIFLKNMTANMDKIDPDLFVLYVPGIEKIYVFYEDADERFEKIVEMELVSFSKRASRFVLKLLSMNTSFLDEKKNYDIKKAVKNVRGFSVVLSSEP